MDIAFGFCHCGCGENTHIAKQNDARRGIVKGQPREYLRGHNRYRLNTERFWEKVNILGPNECWEWQAYRRKGYGIFGMRSRNVTGAHQFSALLAFGPVPDGKEVLHSCDNRACVNPAHLSYGTRQDNMDDMKARGREVHPAGDDCPTSKLTSAKVVEIRRRLEQGESQASIAKGFGITSENVHHIRLRHTWKHI